MSQHQFQTEVSQLLQLIIHSLYSHKEIFLRELVSNASDAIDKFKYATLTDERFKNLEWSGRIDLRFTEGEARVLEIEDNGIGMNEADLIEHLGTIAKSGTKNFMAQLSQDAKANSNLIGQFGVGFYSAFMVASKVEVESKKAGEEQGFLWTSDGSGGFEITPLEKSTHGTLVRLHLNEEGKEYANRWQLEQLIKKYSNHIAFPIFLHYEKTEYDKEGKPGAKTQAVEQINSANAIWTRNKADLSKEDYSEFYKSLSHGMDEPLFWLHTRAEGTLEYTSLLYVPKTAPFDLYYANYQAGVKLYVRRVFITDDEKELLPTWLRFVRGVIDSSDLPLNVSREILQQNKVMRQIRTATIKKLLTEFARIQSEEPETYAQFIQQFNRPLKEGLYQDYENRDAIAELVRYHSSKESGLVGFKDYVERIQPEQKVIYYLTGGSENVLRASPLLEAYNKKGIEVLIASDEIDEIVLQGYTRYKDFDLKPINRANAGEDLKTETDEKAAKEAEPILGRIKNALANRVKDVKASSRLLESPACVVTDDSDPTFQMQAMFRQMGRESELPPVLPILELNPSHPLITGLKDASDARVEDTAHVLLAQSLLLEGAEIPDKADFVKRLNRLLG
ncbi:MAG: molecular chaperone HtpG [Deinococcales bacterium]